MDESTIIIEDVNGTVKVNIHKDKMKAFLETTPPSGNGIPCSLQMAKSILAEKGVAFGIDEKQIVEALLEKNWGIEVLVAQGKPAVDGKDAIIEYKFVNPKEKLLPQADEGGNIDFREMGLVNNITKGTILALRTPPLAGESGMDVLGHELIPRAGKDFALPKGKNTVGNNEGTVLIAMIDGQISISDRKVTVSPVIQLNGDVDFSSGNIDFIGSVLIRGNINSGFIVKAQGDIEVGGFVEAAEVVAGGNILVKGGIKSGAKGFVKAGENLTARFIENSRAEAGQDIIVKEGIMQSYVRAGGSIKVSDKKATIVGGVVQAAQMVEAKVLGSNLATRTIVEVGVNPYYREEYQSLIKIRTDKKKIMDNLNNNMQAFQRSGIAPQSLPENKRLVLLKTLDDFKKIKEELATYDGRIIFLEEELNRIKSARVRALEVAYPGVRISIGSAIYIINDICKYAQFILDEGEVRLTSLT
ncbi:MAG: FapA family protein [Syntrophomonas sp.]|nr:FapA family protein [Syntrophomonas sp.]